MRTLWLGALLVVALIPQDEAVRAQWNPAPGTKATYRFTNHHPEIKVSWEDKIQVTKVSDGKVTLSHQVGEPEVTKDGKTVDVRVGLSNEDEVLLVSGAKAQTGPYELEVTFLGGFLYPDRALKKGETWTLAIAATSSLPKADASATFVGEEKVKDRDALKYDYSFSVLGGASAKGTVWLQKSDGMLLKRVTQLHDVDYGGGPEDTKQEIERID